MGFIQLILLYRVEVLFFLALMKTKENPLNIVNVVAEIWHIATTVFISGVATDSLYSRFTLAGNRWYSSNTDTVSMCHTLLS